MKIGIGIDTGGTCTDAVAFDLDAGTLLAKGKALTTRENLSIGIADALDRLPSELVRDASHIALSTTLATNACVENKGCRARLLVFGLTDELLVRFGAEKDFGMKAGSARGVEAHGSADGFDIEEPDWDAIFAEHGEWLKTADALAAAEVYSGTNGAPCEKGFAEQLSERFGVSCVCANELSGELNVLARGATALLNARLFPIVREFIEAALSDLRARGCSAPVMIVRSDGGLMSAERSLTRPVETILSGPAASVLSGKKLADMRDYLMIDMGGTTTDVSIVQDDRPAMADDGIKIGGWRTHVKGVLVDTFALGGDSAVRMDGDFLRIFPRRVTPICTASERWPEIKPMLEQLLKRKRTNQFPLHELFYLVKQPPDLERYNMYERQLIDALSGGPRLLGRLAEDSRIDLYHLDSERLEAEGIIMRCGLTPTDFMHIKGDYTEYDGEASKLAARFLLLCLEREDTENELAALADEVYDMIEGRLYENLVRILLARQNPKLYENGIDAQMMSLIRETWASRRSKNGFLRSVFSTGAALVGVGAPTHVFLREVADALGTHCVLPEHAEVANAIGALKANISAVGKVEISQRLEGTVYYIVHAPSGSLRFEDLDSAIPVAEAASREVAIREARARGAVGELTVSTRTERHSTISRWGTAVKLGGTAITEAIAGFID